MNQRSFKHAWGVWRNGALSGIIGFGALFAVAEIRAQPIFTNINAGLTGVFNGSAAWGDYDNDGRLDILFTGRLNTIPGDFVASQIWRNTGSGFTNNGFNLSGAEFGSVSWGDYDNDGLLDFLVTGNSLSQNEVVWHNTGTGFTNVFQAGLPHIGLGSASAWGDYDHDGRLDILLTGMDTNAVTWLCRNTGVGFTNLVPLIGVNHSAIAWGDYDNDGLLDILLSGQLNGGSPITRWLRNTNGVFVTGFVGITGISNGAVALADYDNDGLVDLLVTGYTGPVGGVTQIWRNTGSGFTNINAGLPGLSSAAAAWGDYDNDGRPDLLLAGNTGSNRITQVWRNTGSGFTNINAGLPGVDNGAVAWGDYDNDGRLDILLTGTTNGSYTGAICQIWRNISPVTNSPPLAPSGLNVVASNSLAVLLWNRSSDSETPAAALTYNVRIGSSPGASDVLAPMSRTNGSRLLPQPGNARQATNFLFNYKLGTAYYWSVQAVDGAFAASAFDPERSFRILDAPPQAVAATVTNLVSGDINGDGVVDGNELNIVLSNYWPSSPWIYMTNVAGLGGTNVTFALTNSTLGAFTVQYSTDLTNWILLGPAIPRYLFTDTNAPANPKRYYRLRWP